LGASEFRQPLRSPCAIGSSRPATSKRRLAEHVAILTAAAHPRTRSDRQQVAKLEDREHFRTTYLEPLLAAGRFAISTGGSRKPRRCSTEARREVILTAVMHRSLAFHRTGAVEVWGRGANRVIEGCRARRLAPPEFSEQASVVTVTFKALEPEHSRCSIRARSG
jgi:hypothetical protein